MESASEQNLLICLKKTREKENRKTKADILQNDVIKPTGESFFHLPRLPFISDTYSYLNKENLIGTPFYFLCHARAAIVKMHQYLGYKIEVIITIEELGAIFQP